MPNYQHIDRVFHALSDATRMAVSEGAAEAGPDVQRDMLSLIFDHGSLTS